MNFVRSHQAAPLREVDCRGISANPGVSTTCGGTGAFTAVAGSSSVTMGAGRTIPANGSCQLLVQVTSANVGVYINDTLTGAPPTIQGDNAASAIANLTVTLTGIAAFAVTIPAASPWPLAPLLPVLLPFGLLQLRSRDV